MLGGVIGVGRIALCVILCRVGFIIIYILVVHGSVGAIGSDSADKCTIRYSAGGLH